MDLLYIYITDNYRFLKKQKVFRCWDWNPESHQSIEPEKAIDQDELNQYATADLLIGYEFTLYISIEYVCPKKQNK